VLAGLVHAVAAAAALSGPHRQDLVDLQLQLPVRQVLVLPRRVRLRRDLLAEAHHAWLALGSELCAAWPRICGNYSRTAFASCSSLRGASPSVAFGRTLFKCSRCLAGLSNGVIGHNLHDDLGAHAAHITCNSRHIQEVHAAHAPNVPQ
jgi:hypothetical protein